MNNRVTVIPYYSPVNSIKSSKGSNKIKKYQWRIEQSMSSVIFSAIFLSCQCGSERGTPSCYKAGYFHINARNAPKMYPLGRQFQIAADMTCWNWIRTINFACSFRHVLRLILFGRQPTQQPTTVWTTLPDESTYESPAKQKNRRSQACT